MILHGNNSQHHNHRCGDSGHGQVHTHATREEGDDQDKRARYNYRFDVNFCRAAPYHRADAFGPLLVELAVEGVPSEAIGASINFLDAATGLWCAFDYARRTGTFQLLAVKSESTYVCTNSIYLTI